MASIPAPGYFGGRAGWGTPPEDVMQMAILGQRLSREQETGRTDEENLARNVLTQKQGFAEKQFNRVFPWMQDVTGQALGKFPGSGGAPGGGAGGMTGGYNPYGAVDLPKLPAQSGISTGDIWNPQQVQQKVNAARAFNDQSTASQMAKMEGSLAGRGYGSTSPLLMALKGNLQGKNMIANTQAGTTIPWEAAQGNAQQRLSSEQARAAVNTALQQALLQAQTSQRNTATSAAASNQNALLQALGSMVGGLGGG